MVELSAQRLWRSIREAVGLARGAGAAIRRVIYWLVLLGAAPLADWLIPEHWLSVEGYAVGLWMASIGAAFALSVQAIYAKQVELDKRNDAARGARREQRRRAMEAILRILMAADRIRIAQQLSGSPGMQADNLGPLTTARQELCDAVDAYAETANQLHSAEALVHGVMASHLRAIVDHDRSLLALRISLKRLTKLYQSLAQQDEKLDQEEVQLVLKGLRLIRPTHPKYPSLSKSRSAEAAS